MLSGGGPRDRETLDGLAALVDQSLVQVERFEESRYTMLRVLREFALEQLEDEELSELRQRHAGAYLALAEEARAGLSGGDRRSWLDRLERDIDNLRAALGHFIDEHQADEAMRFAYAVWRLWQTRGMLYEGRATVERVLQLDGGLTRSQMRAHEALGGLAYWQTDYEAMAEAYQRALDLARELGDPLEEAKALHNASYSPNLRGEAERVVALLQAASDLYRTHGDDVGLSEVLTSLAVIQEDQGEYRAALDAAERAIEVARRSRNDSRLSWALFSAAYLAFEADDPVARDYLDESLVMFERDKDLAGIAFALGATALLSLEYQDGTVAALMYGAARRHMEVADTNLFMSGEPIQDRLERLAALAEEHSEYFERGRAMSTREAVATARQQSSPPRDQPVNTP